MIGGIKLGGYTVVEVMIFLTVSAGLFIIASQAINGQQAKTEFTQATRDFESSLDDVLNDVSTGVFGGGSNFTCKLSGGPGTRVAFTAANTPQGANTACIFLGKVLQFNKNSSDYNIFTVAGTRLDSSGNEVKDLTHALPTPIATGAVDITGSVTTEYGLTITDVIEKVSGPVHHDWAIALFTSLASYSSGDLVAGSPTSNIIPVPGSTGTDPLSSPYTAIASKIKNIDNTAPKNPVTVICLEQGSAGSGGRRAAIIIGANDRQVYSELHIGDMDSAVAAVLGGVKCPAA